MNIFDIVILVGPNDYEVIHAQIEYTKKNIIGFRNIYLLCSTVSLSIPNCITIPESIFPFSIETVATYHGKIKRNGWYLQQLLKLYAGIVIPNILDKYLVIDADTFFLRPTTFYENGKCMYNYGYEFYLPYFDHMKKLHPDLQRIDKKKSGICHHMIFETIHIKEIFAMIETLHNDTFYNVFLKNVTDTYFDGSGASEYEIYFNFMLLNHPDEIIIRKLQWDNVSILPFNSNYDYVSYHWHIRQRKKVKKICLNFL